MLFLHFWFHIWLVRRLKGDDYKEETFKLVKFTSQTCQLLDQTRIIISVLADHLFSVPKRQDTPCLAILQWLQSQTMGSLHGCCSYQDIMQVSAVTRENKIPQVCKGSFSTIHMEQVCKSDLSLWQRFQIKRSQSQGQEDNTPGCGDVYTSRFTNVAALGYYWLQCTHDEGITL